MATRLKEIVKKYGKVALGVHFTVSGVSISGLYIAIKNNVDVESIFEKYHIPGFTTTENPTPTPDSQLTELIGEEGAGTSKNKTKELAASAGGAFAVAILCNKILFPIRVPITMALTPPIARFLARRKIVNSGV